MLATLLFGCGSYEPVPFLGSRDAASDGAVSDARGRDGGALDGMSGGDDGAPTPDGGETDGASADSAPADGEAPRDGSGADAVAQDALLRDAIALDALAPDAPAADAFLADAPAVDAPAPDAIAPDAIAPDAVAPDAVSPIDAAAPDAAGPADSGTVDAGAPGRCERQSDCDPALVCGGPTLCAGSVCYACMTRTGTRAIGAPCTSGSSCSSGVCDGVRARCSAACANGTTGDADCVASAGSGQVCTELTVTIGMMSARLGYCARGCTHNADCNAPDLCQGTGNTDAHRVDLACGPGRPGTADFNASCMSGSDCAASVCLANTVGMVTTRRCTAFCVSAADCGGRSAGLRQRVVRAARRREPVGPGVYAVGQAAGNGLRQP